MSEPITSSVQASAPPPIEAPKSALEKLVDQYDISDIENQYADDQLMEAPSPVAPGKGSAAGATPLAPALPEKPTEPKKHVHNEITKRLATDFGFTQADIEATEPAVLDDRVYWMNRQRMANAQQNRASDTAQKAVDNKQPVVPQVEKLDFGGMTMKDAAGKDVPVDEEEIHPVIVHVLRETQKEIRSLKAKVATFEQIEGQRQTDTVTSHIDRGFDKLAEKYGHIVGKGRPANNAPEWSKRLAIFNEARRMAGDKAPLESVLKSLETAADLLYGGIAKPASGDPSPPAKPAPARNPATGQFTAEQWNRGGLMQPTAREAPADQPGERRATRAVKSFLATNGVAPEGEPGEYASPDDFPEM